MKKSYDYFKTLKNMSDKVSAVYNSICQSSECKKDIMFFHSIRCELSEKLAMDFVAPIERNDIYNLSSSLAREIRCLGDMEFLSRCKGLFGADKGFLDVLNMRGGFFVLLSETRTYGSLRSDINSARAIVRNIVREYLTDVPAILSSDTNVLWRYMITDGMVKFIRTVDNTLDEIERTTINNS